jgi:hypothetical protein
MSGLTDEYTGNKKDEQKTINKCGIIYIVKSLKGGRGKIQ